MKLPIDAVKTREGAAYLGGAAVVAAITLGIFIDTVNDYQAQEARTEATRAFLSGRNDARERLLEFTDDVEALCALGVYELERSDLDPQRVEAADNYFNRAFSLNPLSTSAQMGRVVCMLRQADARSDLRQRRAAAEEASNLLTAVPDASDPDVLYLRGAIDVLLGDLEQAKQRLDNDERLSSRAGMAARHWNRGVVSILGREGDALERFMLGYQQRPWALPNLDDAEEASAAAARYEPAIMLLLAYRTSLDPQIQPAALSERCDAVLRAVEAKHKQGINAGPFLPSRSDTARIRNALGVALVSCERLDEAVDQFDQATKTDPDELLYQRNLAQARYLLARSLPADHAKREAAFATASREWAKLAEALSGQEGREEELSMAVSNTAGVMLDGGYPASAAKIVQGMRAYYKDDLARWNRDVGAMLDHAGNPGCVRPYSEAVRLEHPEAREIGRRMRRYR